MYNYFKVICQQCLIRGMSMIFCVWFDINKSSDLIKDGFGQVYLGIPKDGCIS